MRLLIKAAIQNRKHYVLFAFTICAMFLLTFASQVEILSLGVIARTGPDFFVLFGEEHEKKLQSAEVLDREQVMQRWSRVSTNDAITQDQATQYISKHDNVGLVHRVNAFLDKHLQISKNLMRLAAVIVVVALIKALALFVHRYFTQVMAIRVSRDLRRRCFEHVQKLPLSFYHKYDMGQIGARVAGDAGAVASSVNALLMNYIQTPFAILSTFCALVYISWKLTIVIFLGFPLIVLPVVFIARKVKNLAKRIQTNGEGFGRVLGEYLTGIFTIKSFAMEDFTFKKYCAHNERMAQLEEKNARYGLASRPILHSVSSMFFAGVILSGLYVFSMEPAELLVYCGLLYVFYEPVKKFADENVNIQRGVVAAERMFDLLAEVPTIVDAPDAKPLETFKEGIEFRNVSFRYRDEWVLRDLSFKIPRGKIVAIVGPTGAGKSTIVTLLPRLYDLEQGEILIDGKPLTAYTIKSLRQNMAVVPQKPFLFLDSIRENIAIGRPYSDVEVETAARNAHAEEFIVRMPNRYNHVLLELGKNLSGGQQQRLAIARALVTQAPILIMDEATSSLDAVSEEKIRDAILEMRGKLTQIIIAHRFSTIEHADIIIYIDHGRKLAEGSKDELLATCPEFRQMWELMHLKAQNSDPALCEAGTI